MDGDNPGGVADTSNGLQQQKRQLALLLSHFLDKEVIQKIIAVDPTIFSTGLFLLFPSSFAWTRFQPHSTGRHIRAPDASTRRHCRRSASPRAHPGSSSGHSPSGMAGDADWHRPSWRWNVASRISGRRRRQPGWRRL